MAILEWRDEVKVSELNMVRRVNIILFFICLILFSTELVLRYEGFGSFPVYDLDNDVKYIPSASQHGSFLNSKTWFFNNRHMGNVEDWRPDRHPNVLLIGNSIVLGGNPYKHKEKLGPILEEVLGKPYIVWSVAAGGWSELNEMAYIEKNPDVLQNADVVVLEYMTGGLSYHAPWPGYYIFPDNKPLILTSYIFGKYVIPLILGKQAVNDSGALPPVGETDEVNLRRFTALVSAIAESQKLVIFFYPTRAELLRKDEGWAKGIAPIRELCNAYGLTCVDLTQEKTWTADSYKDDGIHPTAAANKALAAILAASLR